MITKDKNFIISSNDNYEDNNFSKILMMHIADLITLNNNDKFDSDFENIKVQQFQIYFQISEFYYFLHKSLES